MTGKRKIVIIGAGHVGSHCAMALAWRRVCEEVVLVDIDSAKAAAQAMDVADALSFPSGGVTVRPGDMTDCRDADIVVISIGKARLPGQTRLDMLDDSARMLRDLLPSLKENLGDGIVITITNPADIVADYVRKGLGRDRTKVFGTGTLLDTARLIRTISEMAKVDRAAVSAFSLGEHGDSSMIPFSAIRIGGLPIEAYPDVDRRLLLERTRMIGMDIINGKGSTEFGIGQGLAHIADAVLRDTKAILPASVQLCGEYGQSDVHCGVPCVIGKDGIERIIELPLNEKEQEMLTASCDIVKTHIEKAQKTAPLNF